MDTLPKTHCILNEPKQLFQNNAGINRQQVWEKDRNKSIYMWWFHIRNLGLISLYCMRLVFVKKSRKQYLNCF